MLVCVNTQQTDTSCGPELAYNGMGGLKLITILAHSHSGVYDVVEG